MNHKDVQAFYAQRRAALEGREDAAGAFFRDVYASYEQEAADKELLAGCKDLLEELKAPRDQNSPT